MGLLGAIWNVWLGLLSLLGNAVLVIVGIAACGWATIEQMQPRHDTVLDVMVFLVGLSLISFAMVRRMIWSFSGLAAVWGGIVWAGMQIFQPHGKMIITPELIAIAAIPPFFMTLYLESIRKRSSDLEISLTEKTDGED